MARHILAGIVTMEAQPWALEENFARMTQYVRQAAQRRARLVVTPETVVDGYVCGADPDPDRERMFGIAQTVPDGEYLKRAAALCRELDIYLCMGFMERDGDELFNSCALFDPQGVIIARHSKVHSAGEAFITPGKTLKPVDTPLGRLGFLICKDREVQDNFNMLGVQGAQGVIIPMDGSGGPDNTSKLRQRAIDNCCWIVVANTWSAVIIDPTGQIVLEKYEAECVSVQRVDFLGAPTGHGRTRFMERRRDLYGPLLASNEPEQYYDDQGGESQMAKDFGEKHRAGIRDRHKPTD